jgi:hypothetical protein
VKDDANAKDFKKAVGAILLAAGATLAQAERLRDRGDSKRSQVPEDSELSAQFGRLLLAPVEALGPGFAQIPEFTEKFCRQELSRVTAFLRQAITTHEPADPALQRLLHIGHPRRQQAFEIGGRHAAGPPILLVYVSHLQTASILPFRFLQ